MHLSYRSSARQETACPQDFQQLLCQARCGSRAALGRAFSAQHNRLLTAARGSLEARLRAKVSAEDLVQDTFVEAQRDFDQFRGHREREFLAWLLGILSHRVANIVRHYCATQQRAIERELPLEAVDATLSCLCDAATLPDTELVAREEQGCLRSAVYALREPFRSVLIERTYQDVPFAHIAARHGWTVKAARRKWTTAVRQLRKRLVASC